VENPGTSRDLYYSAGWQVLEERVGGQAQVQYVWSPVYVDALVLRDRDADSNGSLEERLWVQQDANFNVTALVDGSGNVVERYVYDPYGSVRILAPNWTVRGSSNYGWVYLHQGGRLDTTSGLYHFRLREYSPALGRWLQIDPLGFAADDNNLYRAGTNAPTNYVDPLGLDTFWLIDRPWNAVFVDTYDLIAAWHQGRKLNEKLDEIVNKTQPDPVASLMNPNYRTQGPNGVSSVRSGINATYDPTLERNIEQEIPIIAAASQAVIFWNASGANWVSPAGDTFLFSGGKWTNARTGAEATAAEVAAANKALTAVEKWGKARGLNMDSKFSQLLYQWKDKTVQEFLAAHRAGAIKQVMPAEALSMKVGDALKQGKIGKVDVGKLLKDNRDKFCK
jgi:RHS repeat-associated protein